MLGEISLAKLFIIFAHDVSGKPLKKSSLQVANNGQITECVHLMIRNERRTVRPVSVQRNQKTAVDVVVGVALPPPCISSGQIIKIHPKDTLN